MTTFAPWIDVIAGVLILGGFIVAAWIMDDNRDSLPLGDLNRDECFEREKQADSHIWQGKSGNVWICACGRAHPNETDAQKCRHL